MIEPVKVSRHTFKENDVVADDISETVYIAQLVEQEAVNFEVARSNRAGRAITFIVKLSVEVDYILMSSVKQ